MGSEDDIQSGFFSGIKHALGRNKRTVSEEDILELVDVNEELLEDEKRMIGDILALDDLTAAEIMQPRVDIIAVEDTETVRPALERMRGTGYSRLPVFHEDLDHVVGIVRYKDLVGALLDGTVDLPVTDFMDEAIFVPETKDILPLLSEMQAARQQMVIVVDEYGGTDGLLTIEDIVEEIVGEIIDETDSEAPVVTEVKPGEWLLDGRCSIKEAQESGIPVEDSDQYETIAGWLIETVGVVPKVGDEFIIDGYRFKVRSMRRRRIQSLLVTALTDSAEEESAAELASVVS